MLIESFICHLIIRKSFLLPIPFIDQHMNCVQILNPYDAAETNKSDWPGAILSEVNCDCVVRVVPAFSIGSYHFEVYCCHPIDLMKQRISKLTVRDIY